MKKYKSNEAKRYIRATKIGFPLTRRGSIIVRFLRCFRYVRELESQASIDRNIKESMNRFIQNQVLLINSLREDIQKLNEKLRMCEMKLKGEAGHD